MNPAFTFAENSASVWRTTCTSRKPKQNCSPRKAHLWRTRSGRRSGNRNSDSLFQRDAVVRNKHTPAVPNPYPDIGQAVVILVRLALGLSPLVIRPGHDGDVAAAHPHPEVGQFRNFHVNREISAVRDVTRFAVGVAILNCNHEIFSQTSRQKVSPDAMRIPMTSMSYHTGQP